MQGPKVFFGLGAASELGRQISTDPKSPGGPLTIAEEAVDQLQENEKLVAGTMSFWRVLGNKEA